MRDKKLRTTIPYLKFYGFILAMSLFGDVPLDRTCDDAGIPSPFCICHQLTRIPSDSKLSIWAANSAGKDINNLLKDYSKVCEHLTVAKIIHAHKMEFSKQKYTDYLVMIETTPGGGQFEANVRYRASDNSMTVDGPISRTNLYGDTSYCVPDADLRNYCYCKKQRGGKSKNR